ncbi:MAG: hypothetical protein LC740_08565, partial [Actinobacteria bacterium]|nr:hypothetical protein [Actinomycetota bacterium]
MQVRQLKTGRGKRFPRQPLDGGGFAHQGETGEVNITPPHLQALEEIKQAGIPGLLEVRRAPAYS